MDEESSTNYNKIAKAVGNIINNGIALTLIDINKSQYMFEPDEEAGSIIYGMKGLNGVGGEIIQQIIQNRPYESIKDFQSKVKVNKTVMISLIKSGAFDSFNDRVNNMKEYLWEQTDTKKRITLQNFNGMMERNMIPQEFNFEKRLFVFNKALKADCKNGLNFIIEDNFYDFYSEFFDIDLLFVQDNLTQINQKTWNKVYLKGMEPVKAYFKKNQQKLIDDYNKVLFKELWDKYAEGSLSKWEMDSLGFYYHPHELENYNLSQYDIVDFSTLSREPEIAYTFKRNGVNIPIYKTFRIAGTVVAKNDTKSIVSILTTDDGVVDVKFTRDYFARYNRRISEPQLDGTKKVKESSWFTRGTIIMVQGIRRGDMFVAKKYKKSAGHQLYKITSLCKDGTLRMTNARWGEIDND